MDIRQAKKADLHSILEFMGLKQVSRQDWHVPSKQFVLSYITNKHNFFIIALDSNKVMGTINGELWNDKGFAYIGEIIAKGKNKQKVIDAMYSYFVKFCKKKGVTLINTYVNKNKEKQIKTYKTLGMKRKGEYFYLARILN
ncbi:MAG: GNAT family N-acetyltransferase [Nanoarchaeota archaeon]|nr:GNAT family N-acetyltransferase [Nanoarchaeota archaeon]